jgi:hypothetical protein
MLVSLRVRRGGRERASRIVEWAQCGPASARLPFLFRGIFALAAEGTRRAVLNCGR